MLVSTNHGTIWHLFWILGTHDWNVDRVTVDEPMTESQCCLFVRTSSKTWLELQYLRVVRDFKRMHRVKRGTIFNGMVFNVTPHKAYWTRKSPETAVATLVETSIRQFPNLVLCASCPAVALLSTSFNLENVESIKLTSSIPRVLLMVLIVKLQKVFTLEYDLLCPVQLPHHGGTSCWQTWKWLYTTLMSAFWYWIELDSNSESKGPT